MNNAYIIGLVHHSQDYKISGNCICCVPGCRVTNDLSYVLWADEHEIMLKHFCQFHFTEFLEEYSDYKYKSWKSK